MKTWSRRIVESAYGRSITARPDERNGRLYSVELCSFSGGGRLHHFECFPCRRNSFLRVLPRMGFCGALLVRAFAILGWSLISLSVLGVVAGPSYTWGSARVSTIFRHSRVMPRVGLEPTKSLASKASGFTKFAHRGFDGRGRTRTSIKRCVRAVPYLSASRPSTGPRNRTGRRGL